MESVNEVFLWSITVYLCFFNAESRWSTLPIQAFVFLVMGNTLTISLIMTGKGSLKYSLGFLIVSLPKSIKKWFAKKEEEPENPPMVKYYNNIIGCQQL